MSKQPNYSHIAPAPSAARLAEASGVGELARSEPLQQRRNTTTACFACRRRRSRCNGVTPCNSCISHGTECVKDDKDDRRRKVAINRRIESLESEQRLLDDLLAAIRMANPPQMNVLVNLIRSHISKQELQAHITNTFSDSPSPGSSEKPIPLDAQRHRRRMLGRIQDLVNPIISVPAKPWTTVTDDDDLVSHLMSLWFTWVYQWWQWMDMESFLQDMQAGNTSSLICTPYLVNMILADACLLDTLSEDSDGPNGWLREQFYTEGKMGIEAEEGQTSFALVAALGVQWTYLNTNGQDKVGNLILYQQTYLAKDLEKWRSRMEQRLSSASQELDKLDRNLDRLMWTLFALSSLTLINLESSTPLKPPTRAKPRIGHGASRGINSWQPYPQPSHPYEFHSGCHYSSFISLAERVRRDETLFIVEERSEAEMKRFREIYQELVDWPQHLPECMRLTPRATPHVLALHALQQWFKVILSKQIAASDAGRPGQPTLAVTPNSSTREHWQETCIEASVHISKIFEQHRIDWGNDHFPVIVTRPVSLAPFPLLEGLSLRPESQAAMIELCITISAASRRFRVGKGILRTILNVSQQEGVELPEQCYQLIEAMTRSSEEVGRSSHSNLPPVGVDWLLEKWDDLDLD